MRQSLKAKLVLIVGCCVGSLAVLLILAGGSQWLSRAPMLGMTTPSARQPQQTTQEATAAASSSFKKTQDGRLIHPVTGQDCPKDMKPVGRRGCIGHCEEEDMHFWEKIGRCIPKSDAKVACEENRGTWIVTVDTKEERCRIPLTEIDPQTTNRLNRFGR